MHVSGNYGEYHHRICRWTWYSKLRANKGDAYRYPYAHTWLRTFSCVCMWQCNRMRIYSASTTGVEVQKRNIGSPSVRTRTENIQYRHRLYSVHTLATRNCFDGFLSKYRDNVSIYMIVVYPICSQLKYNWLWKKWCVAKKRFIWNNKAINRYESSSHILRAIIPLSLNFCIKKN